MTKIKKAKKTEETPVEPVVEVKPEVEEVVEEPISAKELRNIYAVAKANNPELYALKNKDEQLQKKLKQLK